jgi:hypothetical protein
MSARELLVTRHAVASYSRRRNDHRSLRLLAAVNWNPDVIRKAYGTEMADNLITFYNELESEISECVRFGLENGLAERKKPPGFVLYRRKNDSLPDGQRFVRCDEESSFGFIVQRDPAGPDVVLTTITRVGVRR